MIDKIDKEVDRIETELIKELKERYYVKGTKLIKTSSALSYATEFDRIEFVQDYIMTNAEKEADQMHVEDIEKHFESLMQEIESYCDGNGNVFNWDDYRDAVYGTDLTTKLSEIKPKEKTVEEILAIRLNNCFYCKNANVRSNSERGVVVAYCYEDADIFINEEMIGECALYEESEDE